MTDALTPPAFDALTGRLDPPMLVVTVAVGEELAGCLVGFSTQCSIHPPRFAICLSDKNLTHRMTMRGAERLAAHLLGTEQLDLARLFGEETGDEIDKFEHCLWHRGPHGEPILDDAAAWFAGPIRERLAVGDHTLFVIDVDDAGGAHHDGRYLGFRQVKDLDPGHDP